MKYILIKSKLLLLFGVVILIAASCDKLSDGEKAEENLIGEWASSSVSAEISVGGVDLLHLLVTTAGLSETEADSIVNDVFSEIVESVSGGTITFNEDHTYNSFFEGEHTSGTWEINSDGSTLTMDSGTDDEEELFIESISSTTFVVKLPDESEEADLDDDGVNETTLDMKVELTLTKIT